MFWSLFDLLFCSPSGLPPTASAFRRSVHHMSHHGAFDVVEHSPAGLLVDGGVTGSGSSRNCN